MWRRIAVVVAIQAGITSLLRAGEPRPAAPPVAAQLYIWIQHYNKQQQKLDDHLDEALAATRRAGFHAVQGWLSYFDTPESAEQVARLLKRHGLTMPAAYAGGVMHTEAGGEETIEQIVRQARLAAPHGVEIVVHNPQPLKREKTDEELAVQTRNLNRLGRSLSDIGVWLAVHTHNPEMRSEAREWRRMLRDTDPDTVAFCLDLDWVLRGGQDPYQLLQEAGSRVIDLHLRSSRGGIWSESLGDGDIDYGRVAAILKEFPYRGSYTVELAYEKDTAVTRTIEENLRRSLQYAERLVRESQAP